MSGSEVRSKLGAFVATMAESTAMRMTLCTIVHETIAAIVVKVFVAAAAVETVSVVRTKRTLPKSRICRGVRILKMSARFVTMTHVTRLYVITRSATATTFKLTTAWVTEVTKRCVNKITLQRFDVR
jgi:hypothetical protein